MGGRKGVTEGYGGAVGAHTVPKCIGSPSGGHWGSQRGFVGSLWEQGELWVLRWGLYGAGLCGEELYGAHCGALRGRLRGSMGQAEELYGTGLYVAQQSML